MLSRQPVGPLLVRRGRWCGSLGSGDDEGLTDLQLPIVLDVIELLQLTDADFVLVGDRGQRLAASDDVGRSAGQRRNGRAGPGGGSAGAESARAGLAFRLLDHLLQFENLLGKRVDLGALRVNFLTQGSEGGGIGRVALGTRRNRRQANAAEDSGKEKKEARHGASLASLAGAGKLTPACVSTLWR